jgi:transposase InsO family protein
VTQAAKNLVMHLEDAGSRSRSMIRDRDGKFPGLFDQVLIDAGIKVVLSGIRIPRMNSIMERWVQTCRRELLDRTLIRNQAHLLHALREFEHFYNEHRPHQGIANARPLRPLPAPLTDPGRSPGSTCEDATASAASCTNTNMPLEPYGCGSRQGQRSQMPTDRS